MKYKYKVSICMIVKDEEANLQRCLDSFLPIINMKDDDSLKSLTELIIIDTGSTDKTVNIAKKFTPKVHIKEFIPWDFSVARNYGIAMAQGEQILILDADEELKQESLYLLADSLLNPRYDESNTIFVKLHNYYALQTNEFAEVIQARIFKNKPGCKFSKEFVKFDSKPIIDTNKLSGYIEPDYGKREVNPNSDIGGIKKKNGISMTTGKPLYDFAIHNKPICNPPYLFQDKVVFNHYGYLFQRADLFLQKKERTLPMLEAEYDKHPEDLHVLTHLIKTYYACNDYKNVIKLGEEWILLMREVDYHKGWYAYLEVFANLVAAYTATGDGKGAERTLKESKRYSDKLISLYLILGQYYLQIKKKERARELFEEAYLLYKQDAEPFEQLCSTNTEVIMPEILNYLAIMSFEEGNYQKAGDYTNAGIQLNKNRLPLRWDIWRSPECKKHLKHSGILRKRSA